MPPLLAFCLIYLVHQAFETTGRQKLLILLVIIVSIAGLIFVHEGKKPFFMMIVGVLYWLRLKNSSMRKIVIFGVIFIPVSIGLVQLMTAIRSPNYSLANIHEHSPAIMFKKVLVAKLVLRQAETRFCLQNVVGKHREQPFIASDQTFWLTGLVPRVIWPDKPNLSLGNVYAPAYCGLIPFPGHSASITLLGQPVIHGGLAGALIHGGILIVCLGGLVWLGRTPHSLSTLAVVALLPWLIDFDQDFTLYVANAVKFFLAMLPFIALSAWMGGRPVFNPKSGN